MSFAAINRRQGTKCSVYRGTPTAAADGNHYFGSPWTLTQSDVVVTVQDLTADRRAKVFGADVVADATGFANPDLVAINDRLLVMAGPFVGGKYAVNQSIRHRAGSINNHDELALESTTEVFP